MRYRYAPLFVLVVLVTDCRTASRVRHAGHDTDHDLPVASWDDRPCLRGLRCRPGDDRFDRCLEFRRRFVPACKVDIGLADPVAVCLDTCRSVVIDFEAPVCRPVCTWETSWYEDCTRSCRSVWP